MSARAQSQCTPSCALYRSPFSDQNTAGLPGPFCQPFPTGIPDDVWENRFDHRQVHLDQVGDAVWTPAGPGVEFPTYALPVSEDATLTAAADVMDGAMIALVPSQADLDRLAIPGGEPIEQLHLTLVYLGEAADIDQETRDALIAWARDLAPSWDSVEGDGFGIAVFNPLGEEPCVVAIVGGSDVAEMHETALADAIDIMELPEQHVPFVPHVTLAYLATDLADADVATLSDRAAPIVFDRIRLAFGGEVTNVPLGSPSSGTEALPEAPPEVVVVPDEPVAAAAGPIREVWDGPLH